MLDIASFDGMWAFEAEKLGASEVVASDCLWGTLENLLLLRGILGSSVKPFYNVSPYNLTERLDVYFEENFGSDGQHVRRFDIVQHLGLLYHLRDPLLSLSQARSVTRDGGLMLIETEVVLDRSDSALVFNGLPSTTRLRDNYSVWWAPTMSCLDEMLLASFFVPLKHTQETIEFDVPVSQHGRTASKREFSAPPRLGRTAIWAEATSPKGPVGKWEREMFRTFRNPGLDLRRLGWVHRADGVDGFADDGV